MKSNVRLKCLYTLLRKNVCDDSTLASMLCARTSVEDSTTDRDESVVEVGFERAVSVCVDGLERVGVVDGDVIWG